MSASVTHSGRMSYLEDCVKPANLQLYNAQCPAHDLGSTPFAGARLELGVTSAEGGTLDLEVHSNNPAVTCGVLRFPAPVIKDLSSNCGAIQHELVSSRSLWSLIPLTP